jgi:hypothetical protein
MPFFLTGPDNTIMTMKTSFCLLILFACAAICRAQGGWTRVTDPGNPVDTFHTLGAYNGASWVDADNDGDIDLYAAPDNLFRNDGNGLFIKLNTGIGGISQQLPCGSSWADFDNDGDMDCFLSRNPSRLYRNNGAGIFTEDNSALAAGNYPSWACAWGEMNNDGRLDLLLAHPKGFLGPPFPSFYFKQDMSGHLSSITGYFFTDSLAPYTVPYWSDYDLDGDMDLFIASGPGGTAGPDYHYKNMLLETGTDTLERITNAQFAIDTHDGQCYNFIDYDNDGDMDLCHTSWLGSGTYLYNNDQGVYTAVPTPFTVTKSSLSNAWGDFDNDGDLDVIIGNDQYFYPGYYRNEGGGVFTDVSNAITATKGATSVTLGDYDNDGDLDVFMMAANVTGGKGLFRNDSAASGNNWISIKCSGTITNKAAIGTKVRIKATINGFPVWQIREILAQNTFQGQHDLRVHFGLGDATLIDSVIIDYLGGHKDVFTNVQPNKFYNVSEYGMLTPTAIKQNAKGKRVGLNIFPNPAGDVLKLTLSEEISGQARISIIASDSRTVKELWRKIDDQNAIAVSIHDLAAGIYTISVQVRDLSATDKFVKSR